MNAHKTISDNGTRALINAPPDVRALTRRLLQREDLAPPDVRAFFAALLASDTTDAQIAAALTALAAKGETASELAGLARELRARAVPFDAPFTEFIDTAGTGASRCKTFNVSTAAAFVCAGAGVPVAKHGARAATSRSGSADVLGALGVNLAATPEISAACMAEANICFLFAPHYHTATARVAAIRRELGFRTAFNLLGVLSNPARAPFQLVGVGDFAFAEKTARALSLLEIRRAWVVHSDDGMDEISLSAPTRVFACGLRIADCGLTTELLPAPDAESPGNNSRRFTITPEDFGYARRSLPAELCDGDAEDNARIIRRVLNNESDELTQTARALVVLNAAAALYIAGHAKDLRAAAALAENSIDNGAAMRALEILRDRTNAQ